MALKEGIEVVEISILLAVVVFIVLGYYVFLIYALVLVVGLILFIVYAFLVIKQDRRQKT